MFHRNKKRFGLSRFVSVTAYQNNLMVLTGLALPRNPAIFPWPDTLVSNDSTSFLSYAYTVKTLQPQKYSFLYPSNFLPTRDTKL